MLEDRFGLRLTTENPDARERYVKALDLLMASDLGADDLLATALTVDPAFALARIARIAQARSYQMQARGVEALAAANKARAMVDDLCARQMGHVEVIALAIEGRTGDAYDALTAHLQDYP